MHFLRSVGAEKFTLILSKNSSQNIAWIEIILASFFQQRFQRPVKIDLTLKFLWRGNFFLEKLI